MMMATQRNKREKVNMKNIASLNEELKALPEKIDQGNDKIRSVSARRD
jgi:hypothetical protein